MGQMTAEEEGLDQGAGSLVFAVCLDRGFPPGVAGQGEPADGPGLVKGRDIGQSPGLADQGFQVVVEFEAGPIASNEPFVPGDFLAAVVDHELRGVEHDATVRPISRTGTEQRLIRTQIWL
ncbi:hypothetical protein [Streptomyces sp. NPDC093060]|uniref:hypothetical protein n=1 Tax=Streptomyces sp. NPDC093060 TaxID=3366019 RepID=UPI0038279423